MAMVKSWGHGVVAWALAVVFAAPLAAQRPRTLVAIFAHADDERIAGPVLARYAREGNRVYLVIVTDGRKGAAAHAHIPLGDSLAKVRALEAACATRQLGINPPILLGLEDAGLASFASLEKLRTELRKIFAQLQPDAVITFGPEGGTGHPDHRLVGDAVTDVVQSGAPGATDALYYPALPAERMVNAPPARPTMNVALSRFLPVRVPFTTADFEATHRAYACHESQYTRAQVDANMRYMQHAFNGFVPMRRWNSNAPQSDLFVGGNRE